MNVQTPARPDPRAHGRTTWGYDDLPELMARLDGDEKHHAAAASTLDVLWVLYNSVLRVNPAHPDDPARDRFLLSKGHGPQAYYAVLAATGFVPPQALDTFQQFDSPLGAHPDHRLLPGVEISSGSLGHGLPIGVGIALGLRAQAGAAPSPRVVVLIGDGELDEGSNHEAIAFAGAAGLEALTVVVIDNASATWGWGDGVAGWFEVAGWAAATVNGRDHGELEHALADRRDGRPHVVVADVRPTTTGA